MAKRLRVLNRRRKRNLQRKIYAARPLKQLAQVESLSSQLNGKIDRGYYILDDTHNPQACDNLMTWARWMENFEHRKVANDVVAHITVSTVFLGLNYAVSGEVPKLFETMIFGGDLDAGMSRYSTWAEALEGHQEMLKWVKSEVRVDADWPDSLENKNEQK